MNKYLSNLPALALAISAGATAANSDKQINAELKASRSETLCSGAVRELSYAMSYARDHGVSKADAVAKIQTIAADKNKSLIRYMAISSYSGADDLSKADLKKYCVKQLSKQTWDEVSESPKILDGGDARTLFVDR